MYNKGKKTTSYSCKSPNVILFCMFGYSGGGGLGTPSINRMGTTCFPTIHSPISISIYQIWKQSVQDYLSNHILKEMSADVDAAA